MSRPTQGPTCRFTRTGLSPTLARLSRRFRFRHIGHWPGPRSLAATNGVSVDVLSSGYLDVSVRRVRFAILCIQMTMTHKGPGFPIRKSRGSKFARNSPRLIATCYVLHRLSMPRHPPNALKTLDSAKSVTCREKNRSLHLTVPQQYQTTNHILRPRKLATSQPSRDRTSGLFSQPIHNVKERKIT